MAAVRTSRSLACAVGLIGALGSARLVGAQEPVRPVREPGMPPVVIAPSPPPLDSAVRLLVRAELARCPATDRRDLYVLVHEATMGAMQADLDSASATAAMTEAWPTMGRSRAGERLIDTIAPGGRLVRLNLRPWRAAGGAAGAAAHAFVASAYDTPARPDLFERYWASVVDAARAGAVRANADSLGALAAQQRATRYAALAHSAAYARSCRPAYRLLTGPRADTLLGSMRLRPSDTVFTALGTEPFWSVAVRNDSIVVTTPDTPGGRAVARGRETIDGGARRWRSAASGERIDVRARRRRCQDGMSEFTYSHTVEVTLARTRWRGCGGTRTGSEGR